MESGPAYTVRSKASRSSAGSSVSLAAAKARAKAEAAKAKLEFHEKETNIQMEKTKLLKKLTHSKYESNPSMKRITSWQVFMTTAVREIRSAAC